MNKRRTIYRGFNKRRKNNNIKILLITASICLVGGYGIIKIKDSEIVKNLSQKMSFLKLDKLVSKEDGFLSYGDYELKSEIDKDENKDEDKEKNEEVTKNEEINKAEEKNESSQDINVAVVDSWNIYTIQVASVVDDQDMNKIENQLIEAKVPFSVVEMDGAKKVQTYAFFDKEVTRNYIEKIKGVFPDAFIAQMKVPVLSLEYTSKYSYIENISKELNLLIKNFEEESKFWEISEQKKDLKEYNKILTDRKSITTNIEKEAEKIDYSSMSAFKDNLIKYVSGVNEKIDLASKAANEENYNVSESLYLSSMQGYLLFINSIKTI